MLREYTTEELQHELNRRKTLLHMKRLSALDMSFEFLIREVDNYIDNIKDGNNFDEEDTKQYIFEEAVEAVYGKDIFGQINKL